MIIVHEFLFNFAAYRTEVTEGDVPTNLVDLVSKRRKELIGTLAPPLFSHHLSYVFFLRATGRS